MLDILLRASLDGAVLVGFIWIAVRTLPWLSPSARAALWWCAAAKFLLALLWTVPIDIAVLPASGATEVAPYDTKISGATKVAPYEAKISGATEVAPYGSSVSVAVGRHFSGAERRGEIALVTAWCAGLFAAFALLARKWRRTAGIVRRASPAPAHIHGAIAELAVRVALGRAPDARISAEVDTPLVTGFVRPTVLLPARFMDLPPSQQRMTLCHELTHVARGDLWVGCVPALAERLFFFHPLVHLAAREYAFWRESACDAAVIETLGAAPHDYGRLLLDLGVASPRARLAAAGASWSFSNLKRRIHMLGDLPRASRTSRLVAAGAVVVALGAAVPFRLVAREPVQSDPRPVQPAAPAQPAAAPQVPKAPEPPRPAAPQRVDRSDTRDLSYVFLADTPGRGERVHMSGSGADVERARTFRRGNEAILWFRDARGEFIVRDPSVLSQVEAIWKPVGELGAKQGHLGAEQGTLGTRMGELGAKQGLIGAEQGRLGAKQGAIGAKQGELAAREWNASQQAQRTEIEKAHRELEREMRALHEEMKALEVKMREFEKPMRELGAEMEKVGGEMRALGDQMKETSERAQAEMRQLLDRAVASGAAQAVK